MDKKKSRMPQIGEAVFCIIYLVFGIVATILFFTNMQGKADRFLYGLLTLILVSGDSFHLVPRIIHAFNDRFERYEFFAGLGLLVSSVTMTIFYLVLYQEWLCLYDGIAQAKINLILYWIMLICAVLRIALCLFPQNNWFKSEGNPRWGILRNIPFAVVGLITIIFWIEAARWEMALAVFISFLCYFPVVLFAKKKPMIGMLMIPKTMAYMWMISIGLATLQDKIRL